MMDANLRERLEELWRQDSFRKSAFLIIVKIIDLKPTPPSVFVNECLHSIFFTGVIHKPPYHPKDILPNDEMLTDLRKRYSSPFQLYLTQLPKRSPFSCVLDMFVHRVRSEGNCEEEEHRVKKQLQTFIEQLRDEGVTKMVSSTICVSQTKAVPSSDRYYGVSMSTFDSVHGQIMVAVSCLHTWDSCVADAVMTYRPNKTRRNDFDGTLQLQELVRCEAFSLRTGERKDPCRSCGNLFGLETQEDKEWPYGHCAEAESISNLLKSEGEVRQRAIPESEIYTDRNRLKAKVSVSNHLMGLLAGTVFNGQDFGFYTP